MVTTRFELGSNGIYIINNETLGFLEPAESAHVHIHILQHIFITDSWSCIKWNISTDAKVLYYSLSQNKNY
jgi:hypothetical protein